MGKTVKIFFLSLASAFCLAGLNFNFASALSYSSVEEICGSIGDACEVISSSELNLSSAEKIILGKDETQTVFNLDSLTINLYSPVEIKGELTLKGNFILNDFNETSAKTVYSDSNFESVFNLDGNLTLNDLSLESAGETAAFFLSDNSNLIINGGNYKAEVLIVVGENSELIINGGNFEAEENIVSDAAKAKKVLIKDGNFKTTSGAAISLKVDLGNIEIVSGTFEASKENEAAEIFRVISASSKDEAKSAVERIIAKNSEIYDLENETVDIDYRNTYDEEKGKGYQGFLTTKKIIIRETGGNGEETPAEPVLPEESETPEEAPEETVETEENPDTLIDHPFIYFTGVSLAVVFGFFSLKKFLDF